MSVFRRVKKTSRFVPNLVEGGGGGCLIETVNY